MVRSHAIIIAQTNLIPYVIHLLYLLPTTIDPLTPLGLNSMIDMCLLGTLRGCERLRLVVSTMPVEGLDQTMRSCFSTREPIQISHRVHSYSRINTPLARPFTRIQHTVAAQHSPYSRCSCFAFESILSDS